MRQRGEQSNTWNAAPAFEKSLVDRPVRSIAFPGLLDRPRQLAFNPREEQVMRSDEAKRDPRPARPGCPVCGGVLIEIRAKLQCSRCHTICETCCEGGRG
jgi:hypothetical protein